MVRVPLDAHQSRLLVQLVQWLPPLDPILGPWVAGGAVRSVAVHSTLDDVHDVDVFFRSADQTEGWRVRMKELGYLCAPPSTSRSSDYWTTQLQQCINLVTFRQFASLDDLLQDFGCTACQFGTDGRHVWCGDLSQADATHKVFRLVDTSNFLMGRFVHKYLNVYGFRVEGDDPWAVLASQGDRGEY